MLCVSCSLVAEPECAVCARAHPKYSHPAPFLPLSPSILCLTTLPPPPSNPMKAAEWAFQAKDPSALTRILDQHTDNVEVKNAVESYLDRLPR